MRALFEIMIVTAAVGVAWFLTTMHPCTGRDTIGGVIVIRDCGRN